jgi:hypothetical protein
MEQNPLPPAKKNSDFPMTQPINKDVMELVAGGGKPKQVPEVEKAKNDLRRVIKQVGVDPQKVIQAGKYAEAALKNPEMYPMAIQNAVQAGLLTQDQVPKEPGVNWQLLAQGITAGRLTAELVQEGKL